MSDPAPVTPEAPSKGNNSALILAIGVAVVMLGAGFCLAYFVLPARIADAIKKGSAEQSDGRSEAAAAPAEGEAGKGGEAGKAPQSNFVLSDILVNISGTKAGRFLKATAYFDAPPNVTAELERKRPQITDVVSATLGQKTLEELSDPGVRGKLRSELLSTINPLLETKGEVTNIYFPEFIIQ